MIGASDNFIGLRMWEKKSVWYSNLGLRNALQIQHIPQWNKFNQITLRTHTTALQLEIL